MKKVIDVFMCMVLVLLILSYPFLSAVFVMASFKIHPVLGFAVAAMFVAYYLNSLFSTKNLVVIYKTKKKEKDGK